MNSSYWSSPTRNGTPCQHSLPLHLPKFQSPSLPLRSEALFLRRGDTRLRFSDCPIRLLAQPLASISSFAEPERECMFEEGITLQIRHHEGMEADIKEDAANSPGMAQAFNISLSSASAISVFIAFAALSLPLFMSSLAGPGPKVQALSYATLLVGFFMAWNIGANDVANAMGTSVGSGALTLRQAVLTAAVLEFSGALLMGTHVTSTMQKGILVTDVFKGKDALLFAGLLSSLAAAGTWLQVLRHFLFLNFLL